MIDKVDKVAMKFLLSITATHRSSMENIFKMVSDLFEKYIFPGLVDSDDMVKLNAIVFTRKYGLLLEHKRLVTCLMLLVKIQVYKIAALTFKKLSKIEATHHTKLRGISYTETPGHSRYICQKFLWHSQYQQTERLENVSEAVGLELPSFDPKSESKKKVSFAENVNVSAYS